MVGHDEDGGEPPGLSQFSEVEPLAEVEVKELDGWQRRMNVGRTTGNDHSFSTVDLSFLTVMLHSETNHLVHNQFLWKVIVIACYSSINFEIYMDNENLLIEKN